MKRKKTRIKKRKGVKYASKGKRHTKPKKRRKRTKKGYLPVSKRDKIFTLQELKDMPYTEYLFTKHWRSKRQAAIDLHGDKCEHCGEDFQAVHHCTYVRRGEESMNDLLILCKSCHYGIHYRWKVLKKKNFMMFSPRFRDLHMLTIQPKKKVSSLKKRRGKYRKSKLGRSILKL